MKLRGPASRVGSLRLLDFEIHLHGGLHVATKRLLVAPIVSAALERGLHVLCEKPLTTNLAEAVALAKKAVRCRSILFPCHNYRHAPDVRTVRHILDQGVIGAVQSVTQQTFRPTHARGVPEWRPDWRRDPAFAGGGILMDHGIHSLYLASEWLRGFPQAVSARTYSLDGFDTEDNVGGVFCYANGILHATLSWTSGTREVLYTLHGSRGAIIVDDDVVRVFLRDSSTTPLSRRWARESRLE